MQSLLGGKEEWESEREEVSEPTKKDTTSELVTLAIHMRTHYTPYQRMIATHMLFSLFNHMIIKMS